MAQSLGVPLRNHESSPECLQFLKATDRSQQIYDRLARPFRAARTGTVDGVNFSLFSEASESVELCLFDASGRR
jgi:hypothetical protein